MLRPYSSVRARVRFDVVRPRVCDRAPQAAYRQNSRRWRKRPRRSRFGTLSRSNCGDASSTMCPSDSHNFAARRTASMQSGCVGTPVSGVRIERDPQAPRRGGALRKERTVERSARDTDRPRGAVRRIEKRGAVADRARHDVSDRHAAPALADIRPVRSSRASRFESDETATRCRNADRTAAVGCVCHRNDPAGNRGAGAAARTAGGLLQVPRIAANTEQHRFGRDVQPEFRRAGSAEQQQPGGAVAGDEFGIVVGHEVGEQPTAGRTSACPSGT